MKLTKSHLVLALLLFTSFFISSCEKEEDNNDALHSQLSERFINYNIVTLDVPSIFDYVKDNIETGKFSLKLENGTKKDWKLELEEFKVLHDKAKTFYYNEQNELEIMDLSGVMTLKGHAKNDPNSPTLLVVSEEAIVGFVSDASKTYTIEPLAKHINTDDLSKYIVYESKDFIASKEMSEADCNYIEHGMTTGDLEDKLHHVPSVKKSGDPRRFHASYYTDPAVWKNTRDRYPKARHARIVRSIAIDIICATALANFKFNENTINTEIRLRLIYIATDERNFGFEGPYNADTESLLDFTDYMVNSNRHTFQNVVGLITGEHIIRGELYVNGQARGHAMCRNYEAFFIATKTNDRQLLDIAYTVCHEMGHVCGARHSNDCVGNTEQHIMNSSSPVGGRDLNAPWADCAKEEINDHMSFYYDYLDRCAHF